MAGCFGVGMTLLLEWRGCDPTVWDRLLVEGQLAWVSDAPSRFSGGKGENVGGRGGVAEINSPIQMIPLSLVEVHET